MIIFRALLTASCLAASPGVFASSSEGDFASLHASWNDCRVLDQGVAYARATRAICVKGLINSQLLEDVKARVGVAEKLGLPIELFVVESAGGELRPALAIASEMERLGVDVLVGGVCASSCAQFLFMAGRNKYVLSEGKLLFHGGPIPEASIERMNLPPSAVASLRNQNEEFVSFYASRSIDMRLLTQPPEPILRRIQAGEMVMWTWGSDELAGFGVTGVRFEQ